MMNNDLKVAEKIGGFETDIQYIRKTMDEIKKSFSDSDDKQNHRISSLEKDRDRLKIYITVAIAIGGVVMWVVNFVVDNYDKLRK